MFHFLQSSSGGAERCGSAGRETPRVCVLVKSVCVCAEKIFLTLYFFFFFLLAQTERSVINISRLPKQKQTIKLTTRPKKKRRWKKKEEEVWQQSLFFCLYLTFWTVSSGSALRKHNFGPFFGCERELLPTMHCFFALNVAAQSIVNTGLCHIPPNDHSGHTLRWFARATTRTLRQKKIKNQSLKLINT